MLTSAGPMVALIESVVALFKSVVALVESVVAIIKSGCDYQVGLGVVWGRD